MSKESKKKKPGRPKMNKPIPRDEFKGIVSSVDNPNRRVEIKIADGIMLLKYLKTFKTLTSDDNVVFYFNLDGLIIDAKFENHQTTYNNTDDIRSCIIEIRGCDAYSYYCPNPIAVTFNNMSSLEGFMDDIDENASFSTIYINHDIDNQINFNVRNLSMRGVSNNIETIKIGTGSKNLIGDKLDDANIIISNYKSGNLKKYFTKKTIRSSTKATITSRGGSIKLSYIKVGDTVHKTFLFDKSDNIIVVNPDKIFKTDLMLTDILNFNLHIKDIVDIYISKTHTLITNHTPEMHLKYLIPH